MFSIRNQTYFGIPVSPGSVDMGYDEKNIQLGSNFISNLFPKVTSWLFLSFEGDAMRVLKKSEINQEVIKEWFGFVDKGGISAFGLDSNGRIMLGCALINKKEDNSLLLEAYPTSVANSHGMYDGRTVSSYVQTLSKRYPHLENKLMSDISAITAKHEEKSLRKKRFATY